MNGRPTATTVTIRAGRVLVIHKDDLGSVTLDLTAEDARAIARFLYLAAERIEKQRDVGLLKHPKKPRPVLKLVK